MNRLCLSRTLNVVGLLALLGLEISSREKKFSTRKYRTSIFFKLLCHFLPFSSRAPFLSFGHE